MPMPLMHAASEAKHASNDDGDGAPPPEVAVPDDDADESTNLLPPNDGSCDSAGGSAAPAAGDGVRRRLQHATFLSTERFHARMREVTSSLRDPSYSLRALVEQQRRTARRRGPFATKRAGTRIARRVVAIRHQPRADDIISRKGSLL